MTKALNDNEPDTFQPIAAATARLMNRLTEEKQKRDADHNNGGHSADTSKDRPDAHGDYIKDGLRRIRDFENAASGQRKRLRGS